MTDGMTMGSITFAPGYQPTRLCDFCGNSFDASKPWHRFCCPACRNRWHAKRRFGVDGQVMCPYCDRLFDVEEGVVE